MEIWNNYANILFADGACDNVVTKNGGWGYVLLYKKGQVEVQEAGFETKTTNNRMELLAVIKGLQKIRELGLQGKTLVLSDSMITMNGASGIWKRKQNLDLWENLNIENFYIKAKFFWIKGHSGIEYNKKCDDLANVSLNLQQPYSSTINRSTPVLLKEVLPYVK